VQYLKSIYNLLDFVSGGPGSTSWRSTVRRIGEALSGSENREIRGVCTVFTARPNVYRRSR
jgi:hypothetical protein